MSKITFKRDGSVAVDGKNVGTVRQPDPSGPAWSTPRLWVFCAFDGKADNSRTRSGLEHFILAAARRAA